MKRLTAILAAAALLLAGCTTGSASPQQKQYTATFLDLFDTVTTVVGKADSAQTFQETAQSIHDQLLEYHQLFDIYNSYDDVVNLRTINDMAAESPVEVDGKIMALLLDCRDYYRLTEGKVNVAMGTVLSLWHDARDAWMHNPASASLPTDSSLESASEHINFDDVILDAENSTVYFADPALKLDVGAVAKGWAAQRVAENTPAGLLISVGGNVCATGPKDSSGTPWVVGIQNPEGGQAYLHTVYLSKGSIVTSGDYQRYFMFDGRRYHHIIDSDTLYPSTMWRSVTIICDDSGLADALSTALFLLPQDEGQELLDSCGALAMWVDQNGAIVYSPGFEELIRT